MSVVTRPKSIDPFTWEHIVPTYDRFGIIEVTPELAKHLLSNAGNNRALNKGNVEKYAMMMTQGRFFDLTGGAVLFDVAGKLRGSQHRLTAVVKSGIAVQLHVRWDQTEAEIMADSEGGRPWSAVAMEGSDLKYGPLRQAATAHVMKLDRSEGILSGVGDSWNPDKIIIAERMSDPRIVKAAEVATRVNRAGNDFIGSAVGASYAVIANAGVGDFETFFELLGSGEGLVAGNPVLALRRLLAGQAFKKVRNRWQTAFVIVKSWNSYLAGESVKLVVPYNPDSGDVRGNRPVKLANWKPFFED